MADFLSVEEALERILASIPRLSRERVFLSQARGRILAESLASPFDSPRFDNAAMDGIGVSFPEDPTYPLSFTLVGESRAGSPFDERVAPGEAVRISTGARCPLGVDTIIPREFLDFQDHLVYVDPARPEAATMRPPKRGANLRMTGSYLKKGTEALSPGRPLGSAEVGLLASFSKAEVLVYGAPRVGILTTGDELVPLGDPLGPGQIVNSNAYMLAAQVEGAGGIPIRYPNTPDDRESILGAYKKALEECDLVVSSGGVSVGDHDHVKDVLAELSTSMAFWKVQVKPGKPLAFGVAMNGRKAVPLLGLPGNPASSFVGFHLFVQPALEKLQGLASAQGLLRVEATLLGPAKGARGRRSYLAGALISQEIGLGFRPYEDQSSGNPALFSGAGGLGIAEPEALLEVGSSIEVLILPNAPVCR